MKFRGRVRLVTENHNLVLHLYIFYIHQEQPVIQGCNQGMAGIGVIDKVSKVVVLRFAQPPHPGMQRTVGVAVATKFSIGNSSPPGLELGHVVSLSSGKRITWIPSLPRLAQNRHW
jgi:hypothetical protein